MIQPRLPRPLRVALALWLVFVLLLVALASTYRWLASESSLPTGELDAIFVAVACAAFVIVLGATWWTARLAAQIGRLREATNALGDGDLHARLPLRGTSDDMDQLFTAFNRMADSVSHTLESRRDLLAGVSHELRSPLARLQVALELLDVTTESEPGAKGLIDGIREEAVLLERLVSRLLQAQSLEHDRDSLRKRSLDLDAVVSQAIGRDRRRIEAAGLAVSTSLSVTPARCMADPDAIERTVSTLLDNVVRHAHEGREVHVETERTMDAALIRVCDRGPGLSADECRRAFDAFYRSDRSRTTATGGTGLGLYLVRRSIEAHGGRARAFPREGGGLVIELSLPIER